MFMALPNQDQLKKTTPQFRAVKATQNSGSSAMVRRLNSVRQFVATWHRPKPLIATPSRTSVLFLQQCKDIK
jgi:hypothetical protein